MKYQLPMQVGVLSYNADEAKEKGKNIVEKSLVKHGFEGVTIEVDSLDELTRHPENENGQSLVNYTCNMVLTFNLTGLINNKMGLVIAEAEGMGLVSAKEPDETASAPLCFDLEYVAYSKGYTQYGFVTSELFYIEDADMETDSFVLQIHHENGNIDIYTGSDEDYAVYDEANTLFEDDFKEIHAKLAALAEVEDKDASKFYFEWLEKFTVHECKETFNVAEHFWTYEELPEDVQKRTDRVEDAYYYLNGDVFNLVFNKQQ